MPSLIDQKRAAEKGPFPASLEARLRSDAAALRAELEAAGDSSSLPSRVPAAAVEALHELVVQARLATV